MNEFAAPPFATTVDADYPIPKLNLHAPPFSETVANARRE